DVQVKILDLLGNEVALLVNERLEAGTYSREWQAQSFASGVYFYQIKAGRFVNTRKMLLLK
ncbi:MAG: T9SS type A sorting domain-containing protein, partial [Bacteroidota bacterium]